MQTILQEVKALKEKMVCRKVDNEMVLVPLVNDVADMKEIFNLNEVATLIWEKLDEANSIEDIAEYIVEDFEVDKETAINDIMNFFNEIKSK